jgi:hypothetical protein
VQFARGSSVLRCTTTGKRRLADEYDAAQERGEVAKGRPKSIPGENTGVYSLAEVEDRFSIQSPQCSASWRRWRATPSDQPVLAVREIPPLFPPGSVTSLRETLGLPSTDGVRPIELGLIKSIRAKADTTNRTGIQRQFA